MKLKYLVKQTFHTICRIFATIHKFRMKYLYTSLYFHFKDFRD